MVLLVGLGACAKSPAQVGSGGTHGNQSGSGGSASGGSGSGGSPSGSGGSPSDAGHLDSVGDRADAADAGCQAGASDGSYVLIDDMETTTHGPIQLAGIEAPMSPGYWYNSGAAYVDDGGMSSNDTSDPPQGSFVFTALPSPSSTLNCQPSAHAAHQACALNGLYDTCGVGFEFAQIPDPDAGADASTSGGDATGGTTGTAGTAGMSGTTGTGGSTGMGGTPGMGGTTGAGGRGRGGAAGRNGAAGASGAAGTGGLSGAGGASGAGGESGAGGAGGAGPSVPMVTVPFDISHYKKLTFWGMTTTPDPTTESLKVKVSFPDTDTDPRGNVCNGGGGNTSKCYNSYSAYFDFTTTWQQFTVTLDAGDGGVPPDGGISIDPSWGYQGAQWLPTQVYGINWQAQRNTDPDAGPPLMTDIWVDDVYFVK